MAHIVFIIVMLHLVAGFGYGMYKVSVGDGSHTIKHQDDRKDNPDDSTFGV